MRTVGGTGRARGPLGECRTGAAAGRVRHICRLPGRAPAPEAGGIGCGFRTGPVHDWRPLAAGTSLAAALLAIAAWRAGRRAWIPASDTKA